MTKAANERPIERIVMFRMPVETPAHKNPDGSYFFQTVITSSGAEGGVHLTECEILERLRNRTGKSGALQYEDGKLFFVPS